MVEVQKVENKFLSNDIIIKNNSGVLNICKRENQGFNFEVKNKDNHAKIRIEKENYQIYSLFDKLYNDIINCNVYNVQEAKLNYDSLKEYNMWQSRFQEFNDIYKELSYYKNLVKNNKIIWKNEYSKLIISKDNNCIDLKFENTDKKESEFIVVSIGPNYKLYHELNIPFSRFFDALQKVDVDNKQIHMEEYLFMIDKSKKLVKTINK